MKDTLTLVLVLLGLALFVGPWSYFLYKTVGAKTTPDFKPALVTLANTFAGILAAVFAVAIGIDRGDRASTEEIVRGPIDAASAVTTRDWSEYVTAASISLYFLVGVAVLVVWLLQRSVAPEPLRNFALIFTGYAASVLTLALDVPDKLT